MFVPVRRLLPLLLLCLAACTPVDGGETPPIETGADAGSDAGTDAGVAPETQLYSAPSGVLAQREARFGFDSPSAGAGFECALDGADFSPCTSPKEYAGLAEGAHTFRVRATLAGLVDASPAEGSWSVDTLGPETQLTGGPTGTVASTSASFSFASPEAAATFECSLDGAAYAACTSPVQYTQLAQGAHVLQVRALDALANADETPATRSWSVDTLAPHARITAGPDATVTAATSASFSFEGSGEVSGFECALDDAPFAGCSSPVQLSGLSDGTHRFQVRALSADHPPSAPDLRSWTVSPPASLRLMAANITSGNLQSYDPGEGIRIFQGVKPDVAMLQEFNYGANTDAAIRSFVDTAFGAGFWYYREAGAQIPNGIVSRYPIVASGEWDDASIDNRDFAWARIDVPGPKDLWAISVHLLTRDAATRNTEASQLVGFINANVPAGDYLVIGGDFNTDTRTESAFGSLASTVVTGSPYPADKNGNGNTNASRAKPYDHVLVDTDLNAYRTATVIGASTFPSGLVFDSRVYTPLTEVSPVQYGDSAASNMQHMAVVKDFLIPTN